MTMTKRKTAAERYKEQGKVMFACWIDPKVIQKIKLLANIEDKTIPQLLTERFSDVKVTGSSGKVIVKFEPREERVEVD